MTKLFIPRVVAGTLALAAVGGTMAQMKKRILNIADYQPASRQKRLHGLAVYMVIAVLLSGFVPFLTIHAAGSDHYELKRKKIKTIAKAESLTVFSVRITAVSSCMIPLLTAGKSITKKMLPRA